MRTPLIAGNWKMHKTVSETIEFISALRKVTKEGREVLICPPFTALHEAHTLLEGTSISLGAQNMHFEEKGAYTGQISPLMLADVHCNYVIIGHSEPRHIFLETDDMINKKVNAALSHNLIPILCVGETLEEREAGKTQEVIKNQLVKGLKDVAELHKLVVAYEPVWAIGTGKTATADQAEEVHVFIRSLVEGMYSKTTSDNLRILYGGSVNPDNISELMAEEDIDGVLVGGASLDFKKFSKLVTY